VPIVADGFAECVIDDLLDDVAVDRLLNRDSRPSLFTFGAAAFMRHLAAVRAWEQSTGERVPRPLTSPRFVNYRAFARRHGLPDRLP
jgi:hypothetical protein